VAGVGDLNDDGYDDLAIGASCGPNDTRRGKVFLMMGPLSADAKLDGALAELDGEEDWDGFGQGLTGPGDLKAGTKAGLFIGATSNGRGGEGAGVAYLLRGPITGEFTLADADATWLGEQGDGAGQAFARADDDWEELLISSRCAPGSATQGVVYLVTEGEDGSLAGSARARLLGETPGGSSGISLDGGEDVDGDSELDIACGEALEDTELTDTDAELVGYEEGDCLGWSLDGFGVFNDDGFDDLATGASGWFYGSVNGSQEIADVAVQFKGTHYLGYAGSGVASAGDTDATASPTCSSAPEK